MIITSAKNSITVRATRVYLSNHDRCRMIERQIPHAVSGACACRACRFLKKRLDTPDEYMPHVSILACQFNDKIFDVLTVFSDFGPCLLDSVARIGFIHRSLQQQSIVAFPGFESFKLSDCETKWEIRYLPRTKFAVFSLSAVRTATLRI